VSRTSTTTVVVIAIIAAALLAATADLLRIEQAWPALVALAVGLAATPTLARAGSFLLGIGAGWLAFAARATIVPYLATGRGVALALGVAIVGAAAIASADRIPFWIGLAGLATYVGMYTPTYAAEPTRFLTQSTIALSQVLLAAAVGFLLAILIGAARAALAPEDSAHDPARREEVGA
jgi:hypothetical protein